MILSKSRVKQRQPLEQVTCKTSLTSLQTCTDAAGACICSLLPEVLQPVLALFFQLQWLVTAPTFHRDKNHVTDLCSSRHSWKAEIMQAQQPF